MKLLRCEECHDIVKMTLTRRKCECKKSSGLYSTTDRRTLFLRGPCFAIGMLNHEVVNMVRRETGMGIDYKWFVIPEDSKWIRREADDPNS